jgi:hypothetical protein
LSKYRGCKFFGRAGIFVALKIEILRKANHSQMCCSVVRKPCAILAFMRWDFLTVGPEILHMEDVSCKIVLKRLIQNCESGRTHCGGFPG